MVERMHCEWLGLEPFSLELEFALSAFDKLAWFVALIVELHIEGEVV